MTEDEISALRHDLIDGDRVENGQTPRPDRTLRVEEDFRLLTALGHLSPVSVRSGLQATDTPEEVALRAQAALSAPHRAIPETEARALPDAAPGSLGALTGEGQAGPIRILPGGRTEQDASARASTGTGDFAADLSERAQDRDGVRSDEVPSWLQEVLNCQGTLHEPARHAAWPLCHDDPDDPFAPLADLHRGGWLSGRDTEWDFQFDNRGSGHGV